MKDNFHISALQKRASFIDARFVEELQRTQEEFSLQILSQLRKLAPKIFLFTRCSCL